MDFLQAEIERKAKQLKQNEVTTEKKYFRRGDLEKQKADEYKRKQEAKVSAKLGKHGLDAEEEKSSDIFAKKRKNSEDEAAALNLLPKDEVVHRLRERGEPIRLFGESDQEAAKRLKLLEMLAPDINKGLRNDFREAMEQVDQDYLDDMLKQQQNTSTSDADQENIIKVKNDGTTFENIQEMAVKFGKGDKSFDQEVIYKFLKFLMDLWATDLNDRPLEVKRGIEGKMAMATHRQTERYLKPLLRKLKAKATPSDILDFLIEIIGALLEREYVKANDSYLQMAIGNAPWPIGVTMVGIHARTGREKIFAQHVAHVLNDETQRKYIQALKRLMTFCQKKFEADPSKSVEYHAV
ncbi:pre-mRNA-splicing factor 18-like [Dendronephthya gigantea]|uniref:pre-mRNA-splicing factor 18-like n=1 Tax=Dendronephthya gigantea TaxID=151771 RepID=UPI00106B2707|nr:pre-mRNA-splicing factor 18-like [Dendronephthya gigantea]